MEKQLIRFTVNGTAYSVELEGWERALDVLRDKLDLTGTKRGCDDSTCGACTVLVNGVAKKSCAIRANKLADAAVETIEGVAKGFKLHPIQQALIETGAVQCGYCIPGIVMELDGLFGKDLDASEATIRKALQRHLCRCTGYEAILDGALLAQKKLQAEAKA